MKIRVFPEQFLECDHCFGLFDAGENEALDLPVTIEEEIGVHFHSVHFTPDHLAYHTGITAPQAWTSNAENPGIPPE